MFLFCAFKGSFWKGKKVARVKKKKSSHHLIHFSIVAAFTSIILIFSHSLIYLTFQNRSRMYYPYQLFFCIPSYRRLISNLYVDDDLRSKEVVDVHFRRCVST